MLEHCHIFKGFVSRCYIVNPLSILRMGHGRMFSFISTYLYCKILLVSTAVSVLLFAVFMRFRNKLSL
jgi:hypothetical protein